MEMTPAGTQTNLPSLSRISVRHERTVRVRRMELTARRQLTKYGNHTRPFRHLDLSCRERMCRRLLLCLRAPYEFEFRGFDPFEPKIRRGGSHADRFFAIVKQRNQVGLQGGIISQGNRMNRGRPHGPVFVG